MKYSYLLSVYFIRLINKGTVMNYKNNNKLSNTFSPKTQNVTPSFSIIKIIMLLIFSLSFNVQAASQWISVNAVGDGNQSVLIDGQGLYEHLERGLAEGWPDEWTMISAILTEHYTPFGGSGSTVTYTQNYPYIPYSIDLANRAPGQYYYKLDVLADSYFGENNFIYTSNTMAVQTNTGNNQESRKVIFIHTDLLGSPVAETDSNGVLQ